MAVEARRDIVFVHGLWTPSAVLWPLAAKLARRGYAPRLFTYRGRDPLARNLEQLARFARRVGGGPNFVAHSLGGVLVLDMLSANRDIAMGAAILIAAPVRGCASARRLATCRVGRWMLGNSDEALCRVADARWARSEPLGVIAGTRPFGAGRLLGRLPSPNDGVVREAETRVEASHGHIRLNHGHTGMLLSDELAERVGEFLRNGVFLQR